MDLVGIIGVVLIVVFVSEVIVTSNITQVKIPLLIGLGGLAAGIMLDVFDPLVVFFKKIK